MEVIDRAAGFDWDGGNWPKCGQHGVPLEDVEAAFASDPLVVPDLAHSGVEERFIAVGLDQLPRPVFVVFTLRDTSLGSLIRPISARYMHREEVDYYAQAVARLENR